MNTQNDIECEEIRSLFLELLKPENNDYKYRRHYYDYLVNTTDDAYRQLIQMRLFIKREWGICRCHGKENEGKLEVKIMKRSKQILLDAMPTYLEVLNIFLESEQNIVYKKTEFQCLSYFVNRDVVTEYNVSNECLIPRNLESFRELKHINNITDNNMILDELINYFRCLLF
jgi:hypothetical protein